MCVIVSARVFRVCTYTDTGEILELMKIEVEKLV